MRARGVLAVLAAAALFGSFPVLGKSSTVSPLLLSFSMNLAAGVGYLPFLLRSLPPRAEAPRVLLIALFGGALAPTLVLAGLRETTAVSAALLTTTEAAFTILIAFGLGERSTRRGYLAMAGMGAAAFVVMTDLNLAVLGVVAGNLLVLAAAACWGVDNNVSRGLSERNAIPALVSAKCLLAAGFLGVAVATFGGDFALPPDRVPLVLVLGLLVHGLAIWLFYVGLREIGAMPTGAIFTLSAVFGAVGGYLVLGEHVSAAQVAGGAVMVALALVLTIEMGRRAQRTFEHRTTP